MTQVQATHKITHVGPFPQKPSDDTQCQWCGKDIHYSGRGRRRRFCSQSCRQRAYEQRRGGRMYGYSDAALVLTDERAQKLQDALYTLRCSAEDILTALQEGAGGRELITLTNELVEVAKQVERIRVVPVEQNR